MTLRSDISGSSVRSLKGRHCLVLGGGGFIGTNLCNALVDCGALVQAYGRSRHHPEALDPRVLWVAGDFLDTAALARAVEGQNTVFHLVSASIPESSNRDPAADLMANTVGTLHLLDLCRAEQVDKVIFASSGGTVYGVPKAVPISESAATDPISAYGISKLAIEKYLALYHHLYNLNYQILRISNPYGRYQGVHRRQGAVPVLLHLAVTGQRLEIWGTGEVVRDFIHVDDVIAAMLRAHDYEGPYRVMNVGSGIGLSINEVVQSIEFLLGGKDLPKVFLRGRAADVPINVLDNTLIARETGWRPLVEWRDGLADTLQWVRDEANRQR